MHCTALHNVQCTNSTTAIHALVPGGGVMQGIIWQNRDQQSLQHCGPILTPFCHIPPSGAPGCGVSAADATNQSKPNEGIIVVQEEPGSCVYIFICLFVKSVASGPVLQSRRTRNVKSRDDLVKYFVATSRIVAGPSAIPGNVSSSHAGSSTFNLDSYFLHFQPTSKSQFVLNVFSSFFLQLYVDPGEICMCLHSYNNLYKSWREFAVASRMPQEPILLYETKKFKFFIQT